MSTDTSILLLLADLVARQVIEVGHPDARAQAAMASGLVAIAPPA